MSYPASTRSVAQITTNGGVAEEKKAIRTAADLPLGWPRGGGGDPSEAPEAPRTGPIRVAAAYLHIPFCFHKCHYCDFYSIVDRKDRQAAFTGRLVEELSVAGPLVAGPIESVFVGGGTPTLLAPALWRELGAAVGRHLPLAPGAEITVEANPETVTAEVVDVLVEAGVNRISIGAQSFDPGHLRTLERWHDPANVARSVALARAGGVEDVSLDLIFGIPGQALDDWSADLDAALALAPTHLSCYGLMYEPGTPLTTRLGRGEIERVDEDVEAAMYETTIERLAGAGFEHYEISNWARPGRRCRHNLAYWTNESWWPLGPGASGHVAGWRWKNVPRLADYLEHGPLPPITDAEHLDEDGRAGEELMLRLRLVEGVESGVLESLLERGGSGPARRAAIGRGLDDGLLERAHGRLRFSGRGLLLADSVIREIL